MADSKRLALHRTVADVPFSSRPVKHRFDAPSVVVLVASTLACAVGIAIHAFPAWAGLLYGAASALCFALYAVDKAAARAGRQRIPESMLLALGLVGGWPGAIAAQQLFRHKTAKRLFQVRFWLSVVANAAIFAWITLVS
jgi:uncharacterized membrane protein YsdA (DUF1294 family)